MPVNQELERIRKVKKAQEIERAKTWIYGLKPEEMSHLYGILTQKRPQNGVIFEFSKNGFTGGVLFSLETIRKALENEEMKKTA